MRNLNVGRAVAFVLWTALAACEYLVVFTRVAFQLNRMLGLGVLWYLLLLAADVVCFWLGGMWFVHFIREGER